ncbi:hypothetical protein BJV77DRAFT_1072755 [Russula vinacea]|nr:hypothetical protein BJV77DRAFT_1072755 [Russula vinacea]
MDSVNTSKASAQSGTTTDKGAGAPLFGRPRSAPAPGGSPSAPAVAAPRMVTSFSLRANSASAAGGSRTITSSSTSSTVTGSGALRHAKKGPGAKKAAPVYFAVAQHRAISEAERIRPLGP